MRKQQVKNLEDEFSNLFKSDDKISRKTLSTPSNSPLIHSLKNITLHQSQSEEDFLEKIDTVLGTEESGQYMTRKQIMLNFKINELRLYCKNLKLANTKLIYRVQQLQSSKDISCQRSSHDLSMMQQGFVQLEAELANYKQQLANYKQSMDIEIAAKDNEISVFKQQIDLLRQELEQRQRSGLEKSRINSMLQQRNEELLIAIQDLQNQKSKNQIKTQYARGSFDERIAGQMQAMIDKLVRQLKYQKKNSANNVQQIKRLNSQIIELQTKLKQSNNKAYELQMALLKNKRHATKNQEPQSKNGLQFHKNVFTGGAIKQHDYESFNEMLKSNRTSLRTDKNRVTAQRENQAASSANQNQRSKNSNSYLKSYTSFTIRVRQAQKFVIVCRIIEIYAKKMMSGMYDSLVFQQLQVVNFNPQHLSQMRININPIQKAQKLQINEESMLYNMAFIIETFLAQVEAVDAFINNPMELNISQLIEMVLARESNQEKYKILIDFVTNVERAIAR